MNEPKSSWIVKASDSTMPWGKELSWNNNSNSSVKTLFLNKGKSSSFKYNKIKDELLICASGKIKVYYGSEEIITKNFGDLKSDYLKPGIALSVQSGCPYRLEAIEDSVILEISSGRDNDPVRLYDDYGRNINFKSTHLDRIIKKWFQN